MADNDIDKALEQMTEQEIQQMLDEWEADNYNSSLEATDAQYL